MKILYWTHQFWPDIGGIEVLSVKALPALRERGYEFVIVTSHSESRLPDLMHYDGIPIHRFHMWQSLSRRDIAAVVKIQRQVAELKRTYLQNLWQVKRLWQLPFHVGFKNARWVSGVVAEYLRNGTAARKRAAK